MPVSRKEWLKSHLLIAYLTSAVLMLIMGTGSGLIYGITSGDFANTFLRIFLMSASKIPAVWMLVGITTLINGFFPKGVSALSWAFWGMFAALVLLWEGGVISWTLMRVSPFSYSHYIIPVSELSWFPLIGLSLLAVMLSIYGLY